MARELAERAWWCDVLGLSVWGVITERAVAEAANRALVAAHPDKGNVSDGAEARIREVLRAREAGKNFARLEAKKARAISPEPMDWEPYCATLFLSTPY